MKVKKLFDKIERFCKKPYMKNEEKRTKLERLISKKIKKTKRDVKSSKNIKEIKEIKKKLKVLKKLYKKVKL